MKLTGLKIKFRKINSSSKNLSKAMQILHKFIIFTDVTCYKDFANLPRLVLYATSIPTFHIIQSILIFNVKYYITFKLYQTKLMDKE